MDSALEDGDGEIQVLVRLEEIDEDELSSSGEPVDALKQHAERTQVSVESYAEDTDGVEIRNRFWLTNAVLLEVDTDRVELEELTTIEGAQELQPNSKVELIDPEESTDETSSPASRDTTYGLDQINAPETWDTFDTKGDGVTVAVLDTGVDVDHDDIELYTENESDPTYPGGWAEFDAYGDRVEDSVPHDTRQHGTHVSGTVAGGNASGVQIGVAPETELMHGLVLPDGVGYRTQIIAGMEWAIEEDADVISMSLGSDCSYASRYIAPVRNAENAGTVVVASVGNNEEGCSGSPGNVYDTFAVGAADHQEDVTDFSGGETIDTASAWGTVAPEDWPDEYVKPDVSAPGVSVYSSLPDNDYGSISGTSMAAPHVSGTIALMLSAADEDPSPNETKRIIEDTAMEKVPDHPDTRYGHGIVDAYAATEALVGQPNFAVTIDETNSPTPAGEDLEVTAEIENTGDAAGAREVELVFGDQTDVDNTTIALEAGANETVTLTYETRANDTGEHDVVVRSANDSDTRTVMVEEEPDPPFFAVSIVGTNDTIEGGETLEVTAEIENTGNRTDTQEIALDFGNQTTDSTSITLDPGTNETITLAYETAENDTGDHDVVVRSDDDAATASVLIETPDEEAVFEVDDVETNAPITAGETLKTNIEVTNTGEQTANKPVWFKLAQDTKSSRNVELQPGESKTVELSWDSDTNHADEWTLTAGTPDDQMTASITISERTRESTPTETPPETEPTPTETPPETEPTPTETPPENEPTPTETPSEPSSEVETQPTPTGTPSTTATATPTPTATGVPTDTPTPESETATTADEEEITEVPDATPSGEHAPGFGIVTTILVMVALVRLGIDRGN